MKFQLVLQMSHSSIADYDRMIELENILIDGIGDLGEVDGHDAGSGEMNIFILTNQPEMTFESIKGLLGENEISKMTAAYRDIDEDDFHIIYPAGMTRFNVI